MDVYTSCTCKWSFIFILLLCLCCLCVCTLTLPRPPDVARPDKTSGADINAICQEAGMQAVRENRYVILGKDFEKAYKKAIRKDEQEHEFYK